MDISIGVLDMIDNSLDESTNFKYLLEKVSVFGLDCVEMAVIGNCQKFIATKTVQNLLTKLWNGVLISKSDLGSKIRV